MGSTARTEIWVAVVSGAIVGFLISFSGFGIFVLMQIAWLIAPLLFGFVFARSQVVAATIFNLLVVYVPLGWMAMDHVARGSLSRFSVDMEAVIVVTTLTFIGVLAAQLARLTASGRRTNSVTSTATPGR